jgi:hypothetical protein
MLGKDYEAIGYKLLNSTAVSDIVGARVYHGAIPETVTTLPAINYILVSRPTIAFGLVERPRYQISCRAETPSGAMDLANVVQTTFKGLHETVSTGSGGFDIQATYVDGSRMIREPDNNWHVPVDVFVTYQNST